MTSHLVKTMLCVLALLVFSGPVHARAPTADHCDHQPGTPATCNTKVLDVTLDTNPFRPGDGDFIRVCFVIRPVKPRSLCNTLLNANVTLKDPGGAPLASNGTMRSFKCDAQGVQLDPPCTDTHSAQIAHRHGGIVFEVDPSWDKDWENPANQCLPQSTMLAAMQTITLHIDGTVEHHHVAPHFLPDKNPPGVCPLPKPG